MSPFSMLFCLKNKGLYMFSRSISSSWIWYSIHHITISQNDYVERRKRVKTLNMKFCMLLVIDNVFNKQLKILPFVSATQTKHIKRNERNPIMIMKSVTRHKVFKYSYQNFSRISIWEIKTPVLLIMSYTEHMHLSISFWLLIGCSYCLRMLSIYEPDTVMLASGSQFISQ